MNVRRVGFLGTRTTNYQHMGELREQRDDLSRPTLFHRRELEPVLMRRAEALTRLVRPRGHNDYQTREPPASIHATQRYAHPRSVGGLRLSWHVASAS